MAGVPAPALAAAPVLAVCGAIADAQVDGCRAFTLAQLQQMPQTSITTATPWHAQALTYSGVAAGVLLAAVKSRGQRLQLIALNDYAVTVDAAQLVADGAIFAIARQGQPMPVSDKGPIFVMFPFDGDARLRTDRVYLQAVWQLCRIDIL
ncbi:MAG: hypothetical protein GAK30_03731 [Paracidovorax wautersii]|uniref:Oxidoreductase molybdopterin-binding domain-containing protein n=1 Tax=Paracidovorax wautersii TaxID=1177982 RepID=A0A7V8JNS4_9BURK|nr:MAG: hypothetical protein GAK30_03731 [Paracidovorax wautersii]